MLPESAADQYGIQQQISTLTAATVGKLWRRMGDDFDASWDRVGPQILTVVHKGRTAAVANAIPYTAALLRETGQRDDPVGILSPTPFLSTAPDGRPLDTLYHQAVVAAKTQVGKGAAAAAALGVAGRWLTMVTLTVLADTRREVYGADIIQRPNLDGYTRMLNPPSCKDCIILAGRWYRWNTGFERHPRCDCFHLPASKKTVADLVSDPYATFQAMSPLEQERIFGRIEARAIRDGADIYRVVNLSNRGLGTARSARLYGTPSRMTVDDIYRVAGTRTNAIRLLEQHGYVTGPQVAGGNLIGTGRAVMGFGQLGRGGTRRAASDAAVQANAAGIRDPLNRYTMTAAERRLYDAHYRLRYAERTGRIPRSIGNSSADIYANPIIATPENIAELRKVLARETGILRDSKTPESVRRLARALGLL